MYHLPVDGGGGGHGGGGGVGNPIFCHETELVEHSVGPARFS